MELPVGSGLEQPRMASERSPGVSVAERGGRYRRSAVVAQRVQVVERLGVVRDLSSRLRQVRLPRLGPEPAPWVEARPLEAAPAARSRIPALRDEIAAERARLAAAELALARSEDELHAVLGELVVEAHRTLAAARRDHQARIASLHAESRAEAARIVAVAQAQASPLRGADEASADIVSLWSDRPPQAPATEPDPGHP